MLSHIRLMSDTSLTMALGFWDKMKTVYIYLQEQLAMVMCLLLYIRDTMMTVASRDRSLYSFHRRRKMDHSCDVIQNRNV
jgi:hypothetical protein